MSRALLPVALAVALLGGWQASLLHPLEHLDERGRLVHLASAPGSDARGENERDERNPSDRLGDTLAALAACAAQVQVFSDDPRPDYRIPSYPARSPRAADAPPFHAHGPPLAA
jgi:hypothetical protein